MKDLTNLSIVHLSSKNYWNKTINNSSVSFLQMNPNHVNSTELKFSHRKSNPFAVIETLSPTRKSERKFDQLLFPKSARHSNTTHAQLQHSANNPKPFPERLIQFLQTPRSRSLANPRQMQSWVQLETYFSMKESPPPAPPHFNESTK